MVRIASVFGETIFFLLAAISCSAATEKAASALTSAQVTKICADRSSADSRNLLQRANITLDQLGKKSTELLNGGDPDQTITQAACEVALWQLGRNPTTAPSDATASSNGALQDVLAFTKKNIALWISVLAIVLALVAILYSRSATRKALRDAGLL